MLHKLGKPKYEVISYRMLSLTICVDKILENIRNRVKDSYSNNNIKNKQQNGFRSKRSTDDNLFQLTQPLKQNINKSLLY